LETEKVVRADAEVVRYRSGTRQQTGLRALPQAAAFWILAVLLLMLVFASAAASPLYRVYQVQFRFSATTLTAVFAVYVLALLITLLFFGSVSDYLGRRPVIIAALGFSAAGCAVFLAADTVAALFVSLGPSLAALVTGSPNLVWGGLVIFLLFGIGATATIAFGSIPSRAAVLRGSVLLLAGLALTFFAIATTTSAAFLAGTAVTGVGFGLAFLGTFRMTTALAAPGQSAGLVAAVFVVAYLAFSVPALIAGVATTTFGLQSTALVYCAALAALNSAAAGIVLLRRDDQLPRPTQPSREVMPPGPCACPPCLQALDPIDA
jgi:hypothetical protein